VHGAGFHETCGELSFSTERFIMGKLSDIKHLKRMDMTPEIETNLKRAFENSERLVAKFKKRSERQLKDLLKDKTEY